eukprot:TRINITY_DN2025_c0_g1_i1.p1 TRINITY_DN2025_c0_g1~~TRINITY_DN2025_c0_g1_i1.p1  ORF type:complete len:1306 (+),score=421.41 TRINITY_DN2025_c0_g1_i1:131-4048(+)
MQASALARVQPSSGLRPGNHDGVAVRQGSDSVAMTMLTDRMPGRLPATVKRLADRKTMEEGHEYMEKMYNRKHSLATHQSAFLFNQFQDYPLYENEEKLREDIQTMVASKYPIFTLEAMAEKLQPRAKVKWMSYVKESKLAASKMEDMLMDHFGLTKGFKSFASVKAEPAHWHDAIEMFLNSRVDMSEDRHLNTAEWRVENKSLWEEQKQKLLSTQEVVDPDVPEEKNPLNNFNWKEANILGGVETDTSGNEGFNEKDPFQSTAPVRDASGALIPPSDLETLEQAPVVDDFVILPEDTFDNPLVEWHEIKGEIIIHFQFGTKETEVDDEERMFAAREFADRIVAARETSRLVQIVLEEQKLENYEVVKEIEQRKREGTLGDLGEENKKKLDAIRQKLPPLAKDAKKKLLEEVTANLKKVEQTQMTKTDLKKMIIALFGGAEERAQVDGVSYLIPRIRKLALMMYRAVGSSLVTHSDPDPSELEEGDQPYLYVNRFIEEVDRDDEVFDYLNYRGFLLNTSNPAFKKIEAMPHWNELNEKHNWRVNSSEPKTPYPADAIQFYQVQSRIPFGDKDADPVEIPVISPGRAKLYTNMLEYTKETSDIIQDQLMDRHMKKIGMAPADESEREYLEMIKQGLDHTHEFKEVSPMYETDYPVEDPMNPYTDEQEAMLKETLGEGADPADWRFDHELETQRTVATEARDLIREKGDALKKFQQELVDMEAEGVPVELDANGIPIVKNNPVSKAIITKEDLARLDPGSELYNQATRQLREFEPTTEEVLEWDKEVRIAAGFDPETGERVEDPVLDDEPGREYVKPPPNPLLDINKPTLADSVIDELVARADPKQLLDVDVVRKGIEAKYPLLRAMDVEQAVEKLLTRNKNIRDRENTVHTAESLAKYDSFDSEKKTEKRVAEPTVEELESTLSRTSSSLGEILSGREASENSGSPIGDLMNEHDMELPPRSFNPNEPRPGFTAQKAAEVGSPNPVDSVDPPRGLESYTDSRLITSNLDDNVERALITRQPGSVFESKMTPYTEETFGPIKTEADRRLFEATKKKVEAAAAWGRHKAQGAVENIVDHAVKVTEQDAAYQAARALEKEEEDRENGLKVRKVPAEAEKPKLDLDQLLTDMFTTKQEGEDSFVDKYGDSALRVRSPNATSHPEGEAGANTIAGPDAVEEEAVDADEEAVSYSETSKQAQNATELLKGTQVVPLERFGLLSFTDRKLYLSEIPLFQHDEQAAALRSRYREQNYEVLNIPSDWLKEFKKVKWPYDTYQNQTNLIASHMPRPYVAEAEQPSQIFGNAQLPEH